MSEWSNWLDHLLIEEFKDQYEWPGVYKIRLADSRGHPIGIGRLLDKDKDGTLLIGESGSIASRISDFYRAYEEGRLTHYEGETLFLIRVKTKFRRGIYDDCKIQFSARKLNDKTEGEEEEERLLKSYFIKYGELPPLNRNLPDRHVGWDNLSADESVS